MQIYEVGILIESIPVISRNYISKNNSVDVTCKSALISSFLDFAENLMSPIEYFESAKFNIVFKKDKIKSEDSELDYFGYIVIEKMKNFEKKWKDKIMIILKNIIDNFFLKYDCKDYSEVSLFTDFQSIIDKIISKI